MGRGPHRKNLPALDDSGRVIIIKYDNRRLYDRARVDYITYGDVADMVRLGVKVVVLKKDGNVDITAETLLQVIAHMQSKKPVFTADQLHRIIKTAKV